MEPGNFRHQEGWIVSDISGVWNDQIAAAGYNLKRSETFVTVLKTDGSVVYSKVFQHRTGLGLWRRFVTSADPLHLVTCLEGVLQLLPVDQRGDVIKSTKLEHTPARCVASDVIKRELYVGIDKSTELLVFNFELTLLRTLTFSTGKQYDWPRDIAVFKRVLFVCTGERPEKVISIQGNTGNELKEYKTPLTDKDYRPYSVAIDTAGKVYISWISHVTVHSLHDDDGQCRLVIPVNNGVSRVAAIDESRITTLDRNTGVLCTYDTKDFFTFENFTTTVSRILTEDDCKKLSRFFELSSAYRERISQSSHPTQYLLQLLEERRFIQPTNIKRLTEGFVLLRRTELIYLAQTYQENRHAQRNSPYEKFLSSLSSCFTTSVSEKLCDVFNLPKGAKESITSSMAPGLALLVHLEDSGIIQQSDVHALAKPLQELKLVQASAIVDEYSEDVSHTHLPKLSLQDVSAGFLSSQVKSQLFIEVIRKKLSSWCKAVSPIPWRKACQWKLQDLYVDRRLLLSHSKTRAFQESLDSEYTLQYCDIFTHEKLATATRIIIEGEPGSGKTMLMFQIANDWCNGKLKEVEIFVPLQLKLVGNMTIPQAIKICYLPEDTPLTDTDVEEILQASSTSCVMLDGLEEYTGCNENGEDHPSEIERIMNKDALSNCKIVLTIRSSKLADFQRCPLLKLLGFGDKERHSYIDKIFEDNVQREMVKNLLDGNQFLSDLCKVPLLFVLEVHMIRGVDDFNKRDYDRVTPFMKDMIDALMPSVGDDDKLEVLSLKELAFNGLCRGKQQLTWQKGFVERNIKHFKRWVDSGVLVVEQAGPSGGVNDDVIASEVKDKDEYVSVTEISSRSDVIDSNRREILGETSDTKESGGNLDVYDSKQLEIESKDDKSYDISAKGTVQRKISETSLQVQFMHKIIQEWFAAEHLSTLIDKFDLEQLEQCLRLIDPLDLHYVLRFTCGLNCKSFPVITKYILKNCRSLEGKLLNPIMDCLCYCFAEHRGDMVPLKTIVKKICKETIFFTKEDGRLLHSSKTALLKYASNNKVPITKVVLNDAISSVTRLGIITFNTGITLAPLFTMKEIEVSRRDHKLTLDDYCMLITTIAKQEALQKACLQFPCPPPAVSENMRSEFSHDMKVLWQNGEVGQVLDLKTGQWRLVKQQEISPVLEQLQLELKSVKNRVDQLHGQIEALTSTKKSVASLQQKFTAMDNRLDVISEVIVAKKPSTDSAGTSSSLEGLEMKGGEIERPIKSLKRSLPKTITVEKDSSTMSVPVLGDDEQHLGKRRREDDSELKMLPSGYTKGEAQLRDETDVTALVHGKSASSVELGYDTASRAEKFGMKTFPYREQYMDEKGGDLSIAKANVHLHIPPGALTDGVIISLTVFSDQDLFDSPEVDAPNLCPLVKCEPDGLNFKKPVQLKIPHCGVISGDVHKTDVFYGDHIEGKTIAWKMSTSNRCEVDSNFFTVYLDHFTFVYPVASGENIKKRVRAVPLISRMISSSEDAMITFWLCNDTNADYDALMHEELDRHGKIPLDAYEDFVINNSGRSIVSKITQVNDDWVPYQGERKQRIKHKGIWNGIRRKSIFRLRNRASSDIAILKSSLNSKQNGRDTDRVTFALEKPISEVLRTANDHRSQPFLVRGATETLMESFGTLQVDIADQLNEAACIHIATCFMLPRTVKDDIRRSTTPGLDLLDGLIQRGLFSEENVGRLCSISQRLKLESVAQLLRNFRKSNPTNMSTVSPVIM